jgi:phenylacetic acid degradation operon negative regulatory protein
MGEWRAAPGSALDLTGFGIMSAMAPKPRSLVLDLFGEYLRFVDAEVRLGPLTTLLGDFDIAPATVRVTMSRLRREGWFTSERNGRETRYCLTDPMLKVLQEGRERIFAAPPSSWDGGWTMVIYQLSEGERQERQQLRKDLAWHGFGLLSTSTWLAPGDRREQARALVADLDDKQVEVLRCISDGAAHDRSLAGRCWDLVALAAEYAEFNEANRALLALAPSLTGADALVARTLLISRYRHFPFKDPQLPPGLRPDPWPGGEAYQIFRDAHRALGVAARAYVGDVIGREVVDAETAPDRL